MAAVTVRDLRKDYAGVPAVDGLSFDVGEGEVYALLGHNGAGKSTTVEILEGHRTRTSGEVVVLGHDPGRAGAEFRDRIGIVLQSSGVEHELTVAEAVAIYGSAYATPRSVREVVELVGLSPQLAKRVGHLSGGQRRRLDLALGIVGRPALLFLDEPTTGFDPAARRQAWDLVRQLCSDGTTVLLTTHYLDEAEHLADRVGVLNAGRLVAEGSPDELIGGAGTTVVGFDLPSGTSIVDLAGFVPDGALLVPVHGAGSTGERLEFTTTTPTAAVHAVTGWAVGRGLELTGLVVARPSLEDVFLQLADAGQPAAGTDAP
jgi:ABC-2 type transport system ATP-binding protein